MSDEINTQIQLQGAKDAVAAFRDLREYMPKNALRAAIRNAASFVLGIVVLLAPKLTGRLARNIRVAVKITDKTLRARVVINTRGGPESDQNAFYWRFLEEGFHTRRGDFRRFPFVVTAFDNTKQRAAQMLIDSVDASIARAERKAKKAGAL